MKEVIVVNDPAVQGSTRSEADTPGLNDLIWGLLDMQQGTLVGESGGPASSSALQALSGVVPELFAADRISWDLVFERASGDGPEGMREMVLISSVHIYVALRTAQASGLVLIASAPRAWGVGLVLSQARAKLMSA